MGNSSFIRSVAVAMYVATCVTACSAKDSGNDGTNARAVVDAGNAPHDASDAQDAALTDASAQTDATTADAAHVLDAASDASSDASADAQAVDLTCGEQMSTATIGEERSVDVIFVIDNSGSMSDEIKSVESHINDDFARIIEESGADYRVIMLSNHGSSDYQLICVKAPLSGTTCSPIPAAPVNGARFFQYDFNVQSWDSLCRILETFDAPDIHNFTTTGWQEWLRPEALKVFVAETSTPHTLETQWPMRCKSQLSLMRHC
jgi:hypothetical protein